MFILLKHCFAINLLFVLRVSIYKQAKVIRIRLNRYIKHLWQRSR